MAHHPLLQRIIMALHHPIMMNIITHIILQHPLQSLFQLKTICIQRIIMDLHLLLLLNITFMLITLQFNITTIINQVTTMAHHLP